jgi:ankyrin repeat protein
MMNLLIEKGANVNGPSKDGKTPILIAAGAGKRESLEFLMTKGADLKSVDNMKGNALHQASVWQQADMINLLIEKGFDINSKASYDATPLHWSVWGMRANRVNLKDQYANCIKTLLDLGGNKSLKAQGGKTAADWATERNLTDIAKMLTP